MKEQKISAEQILSDIKGAFNDLREGLDPNKLTAEEIEGIRLEMEKGEYLLYKIKMDMHLDDLLSNSPDMPVRDVVIKLLALLHPDVSADMVVKTIDYTSKKWEKRVLKMAA